MKNIWTQHDNHDHRSDHKGQYNILAVFDSKNNRNTFLPNNQISLKRYHTLHDLTSDRQRENISDKK